MTGAIVQIVVGVSDAKVSSNAKADIITHSLGSCVGVTLYDPATGIGGLLHFQLPQSSDDPHRATEKPWMYADTGMKKLLTQMESQGASRRRMKFRICGGAQMLGDAHLFDIGRRNHIAIRKIAWQLGMFIDSEHIGGNMPRTMWLSLEDGSVSIRCNQQVTTLR